MKIAIIGSGISGLTSAYLLSKEHQVTVFESDSRIGGHTHTVDVEINGKTTSVDTGFIVFNDWTYPNFIALLEQLGVPSQATEMSFSVHQPQTGFEYNGHSLSTLFAQRSNLFSLSFWALLRDIVRFNRQTLQDLEQQRLSADITLGQYLKQNAYGQRFIDQYIVPMGSAIWSMSLADMLDFPLAFFIRFFKNHGLLSVSQRPQWRVVCGGSSRYLAPLTERFAEHIRTQCPVLSVERDPHGVKIRSSAGLESFDKVVFACHSDQALSLLSQPSQAEQQILGAMRYADNEVVLHTDTRLLPTRKAARASWNYRLSDNAQQPAAVTYCMNILQGLHSETTFCVSLNQTEQIDPAKILRRFNYAHPQFSLPSIAAQARWQELHGAQHTYFCGAYWGNGFHEDGVVSALRVAQAFGLSL